MQHRRQKLGTLLLDAEDAASRGHATALWQVVRQLAPKSTRKSWQFREHRKLLHPQAEVNLIADYWTGTPVPRFDSVCHVSAEEVETALRRIGPLKAIPQHYAPGILWKACATQISQAGLHDASMLAGRRLHPT